MLESGRDVAAEWMGERLPLQSTIKYYKVLVDFASGIRRKATISVGQPKHNLQQLRHAIQQQDNNALAENSCWDSMRLQRKAVNAQTQTENKQPM